MISSHSNALRRFSETIETVCKPCTVPDGTSGNNKENRI